LTRTRRLSFFVMVLCYSRRMYLEFTVSQMMEFFLQCHENAFAAFGGVSRRVMVDNLKSAVLQRLVGQAPVFNAKYLDFSRHWGFEISPCNVRAGNEKGRVENGVGFVKKNFLAGLELADFSTMQPAAQLWVDTVADVRMHESTHQRPTDRFEDERAKLTPLQSRGIRSGAPDHGTRHQAVPRGARFQPLFGAGALRWAAPDAQILRRSAVHLCRRPTGGAPSAQHGPLPRYRRSGAR
jgi:hypothetical protein